MTELLAPAGNWDCARAAVANGADAIYFGLPKFNARMRADNFTEEDLPELMDFLHRHGVKGFVAFNTLVFPSELAGAVEQIETMARSGVDAVIVQDLGAAKLVQEIAPEMELHASTQMTITSPEGLAFVDGFLDLDRAVLAREMSVEEITRVRKKGEVPLELLWICSPDTTRDCCSLLEAFHQNWCIRLCHRSLCELAHLLLHVRLWWRTSHLGWSDSSRYHVVHRCRRHDYWLARLTTT
ncbi:U32 family peptidase [Akkermansiaceae bacterium]|nr:U32 family peptidase [Akkermansiaceae bacterium]